MEMEKNTSHSFIHSTTAGRTALYTLYTAGIGSAACIYVHHKLSTLCIYVLGVIEHYYIRHAVSGFVN